MKRKICLALLMCITVLSLAACGKKASDAPVVGTWNMTKASSMGVTMEMKDFLDTMGKPDAKVELQVDADGKFSMDLLGETETGTWTWKEPTMTLKSDSETLTATLENEVLSIEAEGATLMFEK